MTVLVPSGPPRRAPRLSAALALLAGLGACDRPPAPPSWIALARGFEPVPLEKRLAAWEAETTPPTGTEIVPHPPSVALRHVYSAADWRPSGEPNQFTLALPGGALRASGARPRLVGRGRGFPVAPEGREPARGEIRCERARLTLVLDRDATRVPPTILRIRLPDGSFGEHRLASSDWHAGEVPGHFTIDAPRGVPLDRPGSVELFAELARADGPGPLEPGEYRLEGEEARLCWSDGAPPAVELLAQVEQGRTVNGQWQLRLGGHCAYGLPVWSGQAVERVLDLPPDGQLSFRFVHGAAPGPGTVHARVRLDGEPLFERTLADGAWTEPLHVVLPLPAAGRAGAHFVFEVEGAPGLGAFFVPIVGPREVGVPGARPWKEPARPDLVLFLVDTFRADSLALGGGDPALAPRLGAFAARSLAFSAARSNAAWTLPSISSLLTGLYPAQHGATDENLVLPGDRTTIAERLEDAGYRTGAVTDGSFFAPVFGLEQGFEWFSQHDPDRWDLDRTLEEARAFLEQDDGRPLFLVVHTYRVHQPYRTGPEEDPSAYDALMARAAQEATGDSARPRERLALLHGHEAELRALYEAGVRDLDAGIGAFAEALERERFFEHGVLVLTSDHGEALGENDDFFHGGELWETKLRVPLFLHGRGIEPRTSPDPAGPIDLAPTFAELAGLEPDPNWVGTSLLGPARPEPPRVSWAFQLTPRSSQVALLERSRKLFLTPDAAHLERGEPDRAYDLERDPGEAHDLSGETDWPPELLGRHLPELRRWLSSGGPGESARVTPEVRAQLDQIGYGGGQE